jgi:hypothetical protein
MTRYRVRISLKRSSRSYATNAPTIARPFTFHIGASFVGKPAHPDDKPIKNPGFPEGALKKWRDETLAWPKGLQTAHPGHDFFYVQEVRHPISVSAMHTFLTRIFIDEKPVGRYALPLFMCPQTSVELISSVNLRVHQ